MKAIDVWVVSCYTFVCVALAEVILLYLLVKRMTTVKDDEIELVVSLWNLVFFLEIHEVGIFVISV